MEDAVRDVDPYRDRQIRVIHPISFEPIRRAERGRGQPPEGLPRAPFGIVQEVGGRLAHRPPAVPRGEGAQTLRPPRHRSPLGREIRTPRLGGPHVGEQETLDFARQA